MDAQSERLRDLLAPYRTEAIAKAVGVGVSTVRFWRRSEQLPRDAATISRLADFLHVDASTLLDAIIAEAGRRVA